MMRLADWGGGDSEELLGLINEGIAIRGIGGDELHWRELTACLELM